MTNEEAIEILEERWRYAKTYKYTDAEIREAFEMAIKALEQQPCEDWISREAVDEYVTKLLSGYLYDEERTRLEDLTTYIWELPSVIPKPCEDAISRQRVLNDLENVSKGSEHPRQAFVFVDECVDYITSVPSVTSTVCDDCISRKDVNVLVDELARAISDERCFMSRGRSTVNIMQDILDLPSVTPHPKIGHWITTRTLMHDGEFYCNQCKCDSPNNEKWEYCPNCGTRMTESEDRE